VSEGEKEVQRDRTALHVVVVVREKRGQSSILVGAWAGADRGFALLNHKQTATRRECTISMSANKKFPEWILHQPWQGTCRAI
jgi:hypothetical protein